MMPDVMLFRTNLLKSHACHMHSHSNYQCPCHEIQVYENKCGRCCLQWIWPGTPTHPHCLAMVAGYWNDTQSKIVTAHAGLHSSLEWHTIQNCHCSSETSQFIKHYWKDNNLKLSLLKRDYTFQIITVFAGLCIPLSVVYWYAELHTHTLHSTHRF